MKRVRMLWRPRCRKGKQTRERAEWVRIFRLSSETFTHLQISKAKFVKCDTTNWEDQLNLFETAKAFSPSSKIHYVVANAGIAAKDEVFEYNGEPLFTMPFPPNPLTQANRIRTYKAESENRGGESARCIVHHKTRHALLHQAEWQTAFAGARRYLSDSDWLGCRVLGCGQGTYLSGYEVGYQRHNAFVAKDCSLLRQSCECHLTMVSAQPRAFFLRLLLTAA